MYVNTYKTVNNIQQVSLSQIRFKHLNVQEMSSESVYCPVWVGHVKSKYIKASDK